MNRKLVTSYKRLLRRTVELDPTFRRTFWISTILLGIFPVLISYVTKYITALVSTGNPAYVMRLILTVGLYALLGVTVAFFGVYSVASTYQKRSHVRLTYLLDEIRQYFRIPFRRFEDGSFRRQYARGAQATSGNMHGLEGVLHYTVGLGAPLLSSFLLLILIGIWRWPAALGMILYAMSYFWAENHKNRLTGTMREETSTLRAKKMALDWEAMDFSYSKEIRLYRLKDRVLSTYRQLGKKLNAIERGIQRRAGYSHIVPLILLVAVQSYFGFRLIGDFAEGVLQTKDFLFYLTVMGQLILLLDTQMSDFAFYIVHEMKAVDDFFDMIDDRTDRTTGSERAVTEHPATIEICDLCFTYPGADRPIFDHFSLTIEAGEKLALVGHNGAGKSTLVKLLCGLYVPDSGTIRINGIPLEAYAASERPRLFNAVFQDVTIFPYTVRENVAMSDEPDDERVWWALREVGLDERINRLPLNVAQPLVKGVHADAAELSGGENQTLAIARAIYKGAPITFLDEPTAALDARAEADMYSGLDRAGHDRTTIYISHRMSSTRFCDRIVLIRDGEIVEQGSHKELLAQRGEYYRLFTLQGKYYQEETAGDA